MSDEELKEKVRPNLKGDEQVVEKFLDLLSYTAGLYDKAEGFQKLDQVLSERERKHSKAPVGRLFYLALPPSVYPQVPALLGIHEQPAAIQHWTALQIPKTRYLKP